ncbi:hypothetical protein COOONC_20539 [Cooperia oncophora]
MAPILSWPLTMLVFSNEFPLIGVYAVHAVVTLLLSILFAIFHRDRPQHHPWVNGLELNRIVAGKVQPIVMVAAGLTNRWSCCSSTAHVRVWNSISAGLTALLFIALPIVFHLQEPSA